MQRLRYPKGHWARPRNSENGITQYLEQYRSANNLATAVFFRRHLGSDLEGKLVLDYGGGIGFMSILCAKRGASVILIDAERACIQAAKILAKSQNVIDKIKFVVSQELPLPLLSERFDIIIAKGVIEHVENDRRLIRMFGVCQSMGGSLILSTQNKVSLNFVLEGFYNRILHRNRNWYGWDPTHLRFYSPTSIASRLRDAGYRPKKFMSVYIFPYDILSWLFLLKRRIFLDGLSKFDLRLGDKFPFNRLGFEVIAVAEKWRAV